MAEARDGGADPKVSAAQGGAELAQIAKALGEIVAELREVNTSLRAIARSQAQQASQQKRPQGS